MGDPYATAPGTDYSSFNVPPMPGPPEKIYKDAWDLQNSPDGPKAPYDPTRRCGPMDPKREIEPMAALPEGTVVLPCPPTAKGKPF
mmetsp:Transcript_32059/g.77547  ORF Transcript_32059/g.77547 Transcript_32059/m.77547 type:complete len:86 (-) Transcript_32059:213-470(-)